LFSCKKKVAKELCTYHDKVDKEDSINAKGTRTFSGPRRCLGWKRKEIALAPAQVTTKSFNAATVLDTLVCTSKQYSVTDHSTASTEMIRSNVVAKRIEFSLLVDRLVSTGRLFIDAWSES
jgi:hypothetical protein